MRILEDQWNSKKGPLFSMFNKIGLCVSLKISIFRLMGSLDLMIWICCVGKEIVFKFIIEYSSLRNFDLQVTGLFLYEDFWKMKFWLVLKLEISYRVITSWKILISFEGCFEDYIFAWWNIWDFIIFFGLKMHFNVNGKATMWHTPCFLRYLEWIKILKAI
jgi:hypothetical protein